MGPQVLLADAFRPLESGSHGAPATRNSEPTERFNDYLEEARSSHPADAPGEPRAADEPADEVDADREDHEPDTEDTKAERAAAGSAGAEAAAVRQAPAVAEQAPPGADAPSGPAGANGTPARVPPESGLSTSVEKVPSPDGGRRESTQGEPLPLPRGDAPPQPGGSTAPAEPPSGQDPRPVSGRPPPPAAPPAAEPVRDAAAETDPAPRRSAPAESAPVSAQAEAAGTARRTVEQAGSSDSVEARPAPAEPAEPADPKKTTPPAAPSPDRPDSETAPRGLRESLHQQKVSDWIEARREGSSGAPHPDGDREETHGGLPRRAPRPKIESGHILETLKAAALKTGHGDGAAASIARFLVNPPADGSAGPAGAPVRTAASGSAPAPAATAPPNLVGDLLASPADGSDAIEGAARLLHANGGSGRYQATMHLEPPELGQLRVQVRMHRQAMTLQVQADTQPVARLIESRLSDLREALATHGIRVDRAHVVVRTPDSAEANGQPSHHQSPAGQGDSGNAGVAGDGGADGGAARSADDPPARHEHRSAPDSEANANRLEGDGLEAARGTWHASISERSVDLVA